MAPSKTHEFCVGDIVPKWKMKLRQELKERWVPRLYFIYPGGKFHATKVNQIRTRPHQRVRLQLGAMALWGIILDFPIAT